MNKEEIADFCHQQWSRWTEYMLNQCLVETAETPHDSWETGNLTIPKEFVDRWKRQIETDYKNLTESEKDSDRREAQKFIDLFDV